MTRPTLAGLEELVTSPRAHEGDFRVKELPSDFFWGNVSGTFAHYLGQ